QGFERAIVCIRQVLGKRQEDARTASLEPLNQRGDDRTDWRPAADERRDGGDDDARRTPGQDQAVEILERVTRRRGVGKALRKLGSVPEELKLSRAKRSLEVNPEKARVVLDVARPGMREHRHRFATAKTSIGETQRDAALSTAAPA